MFNIMLSKKGYFCIIFGVLGFKGDGFVILSNDLSLYLLVNFYR